MSRRSEVVDPHFSSLSQEPFCEGGDDDGEFRHDGEMTDIPREPIQGSWGAAGYFTVTVTTAPSWLRLTTRKVLENGSHGDCVIKTLKEVQGLVMRLHAHATETVEDSLARLNRGSRGGRVAVAARKYETKFIGTGPDLGDWTGPSTLPVSLLPRHLGFLDGIMKTLQAVLAFGFHDVGDPGVLSKH